MNYESSIVIAAHNREGVSYKISRMSFGRRVELTRKVRDLGQRMEFREAGSELSDKLEARLLSCEIDRLYLDWGLVDVFGLNLDGAPATPDALITAGPEDLCREILAAIKVECGLSEEERKN